MNADQLAQDPSGREFVTPAPPRLPSVPLFVVRRRSGVVVGPVAPAMGSTSGYDLKSGGLVYLPGTSPISSSRTGGSSSGDPDIRTSGHQGTRRPDGLRLATARRITSPANTGPSSTRRSSQGTGASGEADV